MKITIEIDDDALQHAVNTQVDAALAKMAGKRIDDMVEPIVTKRLERFNIEATLAHRVDVRIDDQITEEIKTALGSFSHTRAQTIRARLEALLRKEIDDFRKAGA